jgi:hypothetical protein
MDATKSLPGSPDIGKRDVAGFCNRRHIGIIKSQFALLATLYKERLFTTEKVRICCSGVKELTSVNTVSKTHQR